MRVAFDVGGVLSKYPNEFRPLLAALQNGGVEVYVISDMHSVDAIRKTLVMNEIDVEDMNVFSADYATHGEECKAVLCDKLGIDVLIDDFPGYVATVGKPAIRLLVMPDPGEDYYHSTWKTDGSEGNFGRRRNKTNAEEDSPVVEGTAADLEGSLTTDPYFWVDCVRCGHRVEGIRDSAAEFAKLMYANGWRHLTCKKTGVKEVVCAGCRAKEKE